MNKTKKMKNKKLLTIGLFALAVTFVFGGMLYNSAFARPDATITPASGGTGISIDTTSAPGGSGAYTAISLPRIAEGAADDVSTGVHVLTLPAGWEFNTGQSVTISLTGGTYMSLSSNQVTPASTTISFNVTHISSSSPDTLTFSNIQVRPTATTAPASGNMLHSGAAISTTDTNYGTFSTVAGTINKLAFTTQPSASTTYGSIFAQQPVVKTQDQFGNDSVSGLAGSKTVTVTLTTGTGTLQGTSSLDIGTGAGNGTTTFTNLTVGLTGAVGTGKKLTATSSPLTSAESDAFDITAKTLTVSATGTNKVYDASTTATVTLSSDKFDGDDVTPTSTSAVFVDKNVADGITINVSGISISGTYAGNYTLASTSATTTANITPKALTVINITANSKTYDATTTATLDTATAAFVGVEAGDDVTIGTSTVTGTFADKTATSSKTVTVAGVTKSGDNAGNYSITQPTTTANIIPLDTTGSFTAENKIYDSELNATATTPVVTSKIGDDAVTLDGGTATYATEDVADGITVTLTGATLAGDDAGNYTLGAVATTTANITARAITVTAGTDTKIYDDNTTSDGTPTVTSGMLQATDTIAAITQTFDTKNVGSGKTLTPAGVVTDGNGGNNYDLTLATSTTGVIRHGTAASFTVIPSTLAPTTATTLTVTVTAVDAFGNPADGANGATAYTGNFYMTTNATAPTWYTQNGRIESNGAKEVSNCLLFNTVESDKTITANSHVGILTGTSTNITVSAGPTTPVIAITAPAPSATISGATYPATFTTNGGTTTAAFVSIDGAPTWVAATTNANPGTYTLNTTALANGSHTLRVKDTVTGLTGYSDYVTFIVANGVDSDAPAGLAITTADATVNADYYTIAGTITVDANDVTIQVLNGANVVGTVVVTVGDTTWSAIVALPQSTSTTFTARATDPTGNPALSTANGTEGLKNAVITENSALGVDGTAPAGLAITTADATVNADYYTIAGTITADTSDVTVQVLNGSDAVGTAVITAGQTAWSVVVALPQSATTTFTARATDPTGNPALSTANGDATLQSAVITENSALGVDGIAPAGLAITTADATVNADYYTIAGTITVDANDVTIQVLNGANVVGTVVVTVGDTTWSAIVALPQSTSTTFTARATDPTGNPALSTANATSSLQSAVITESTTAGQGNGTLAVTSITPVLTYATAGGGFDAGWSWTFNVTVPTSEASTSMKFADWVSGANSISVFANATSNIRIYSAQSSNAASAASAIYMTAANTYSDAMTLNADLDSTIAGRQIQIVVEARVPTGSAGGSYSTSYGIQSQ